LILILLSNFWTTIIANLNYFKKYFEFELKQKIRVSKLYRITALIYQINCMNKH
jgi:Na+/alanine symporter